MVPCIKESVMISRLNSIRTKFGVCPYITVGGGGGAGEFGSFLPQPKSVNIKLLNLSLFGK